VLSLAGWFDLGDETVAGYAETVATLSGKSVGTSQKVMKITGQALGPRKRRLRAQPC
jgi:hypothetical protein